MYVCSRVVVWCMCARVGGWGMCVRVCMCLRVRARVCVCVCVSVSVCLCVREYMHARKLLRYTISCTAFMHILRDVLSFPNVAL